MKRVRTRRMQGWLVVSSLMISTLVIGSLAHGGSMGQSERGSPRDHAELSMGRRDQAPQHPPQQAVIEPTHLSTVVEHPIVEPAIDEVAPPATRLPVASVPTAPVEAQTPRPAPATLGQRCREAVALAAAAARGDAQAATTRAERLLSEVDPRVRSALTTGEMPALGEANPSAPGLPLAARQAEPGTYDGYWLDRRESGAAGTNNTYHSAITVDASGHATVETEMEGDNPASGLRCRVRYQGWAWRDTAGNLVIDGRGQHVEELERPDWNGWSWSPDSMVVSPNGSIETIDDRHAAGEGSLGGSAVN